MTPRETARASAEAALAALERSRQQIDDLNVFPDGDTGTNMAQTVAAVVAALAQTEAETPAELARVATRAALIGARGNSGVILSQILRGAAEVLGEASAVDQQVLVPPLGV